jgi:hypothetical protein
MKFSQLSRQFSPLFGPSILPNTLFSNTLIRSSYNVRDKISRPYRTTGKAIILSVMILTFSNSMVCTEWQQALPELSLILISS